MSGWIKLHRDIRGHWVFQRSDYFIYWIDLLMMANHTDKTWLYNDQLIPIKRGEVATSLIKLSERWKCSRNKTRRFLNLLEKDQMIIRKRDTLYTHLNICNYETYQDGGVVEGTTEGQQKDRRGTGEGTQLKNVKNVKNVKKNTRSVQIDKIRDNLTAYSKKYPTLNIQFYYDSFVDWLDATGKQYKKYDSAFNNCCRSEWYTDRPGSTKADTKKSTDIILACPTGHYSRNARKGIRGVCPKCDEQLLPNEEIQLERAIA